MPLAFELTDIALASDGSVTFTSSATETKSELMGKVTDFYGEPIGKANLTLIPQSGGSSLTASTDGVGTFLFGQPLAAGEYILCCEASGYESEKKTFTMGESPIALDFMLLKEGESRWNISWSSGELYNAIGADEAFSIAALWEPGDIGLLKKTSLVSASVYVYEGKPEITARVYVDGVLSGEKKIPSSSVKEGGYNVVDFSDLKIEYQNTQSLQIVFLFSKFSGFCYLGTDGGPAHAGNGDLFGNAVGGELTSLYESEDFNSNWLLYITLEGDCIQSLEDGLVSLSGQRSMYLEWNPIGDVWSCSCVGEGQTFSVDTLTRPSVLLENLTPGKTYEITLEGFSADGTKVSAYTFTHSMTFIQDKPMYISYLASSFKKDGRMLLEVYNLPDKAKVTWTVDGKEYKEPLLYGKGSSQIVEAHISLPSGGGTETIRRKVTSSATSKSSLVNAGQPGVSLPKLVMKKL